MNYVVLDEVDDSIDIKPSYSKKQNINIKQIILIFLVILFIIIGYIIIKSFSNSYNYEDIEKQMVLEAQKYINNQNLNTENGMYVMIDRLSTIKLGNNCSSISGVLVEGNSYHAYLICDDYKSNPITNQEQYGKLNGDEIILINSNYEYYDLGCYTSYNIEVTNNYVNREGVYTYLYKIKNNNTLLETIVRKVIVIDEKNKDNYPSITLNGSEIVYLKLGETYQEQGATAYDKKDGDISSLVNIISNINYGEAGEYEIKYIVTNTNGYSSSIRRKIVIVGNNYNDDELIVESMHFPTSQTNNSVEIVMMVNGDNYKHTILPDGKIISDSVIRFKVEENNTYNFQIYDKNDEVILKQIEINNIDKVMPIGVCKAKTYKKYTEVSITNVSENLCVYSYESLPYESVYMSDKDYRIPVGELEKLNVNIKDSAGNVNKINCTIEKDMSVINKEYINEKGYHCIEPYTCYKQSDFSSEKYSFCSSGDPNWCGPISKTGCSITSVSTILSKWDKRSSNGQLFTPYTLFEEVYNCSLACSGSTTSQKAFIKLGLQAWGNVNGDHYKLTMENYDVLYQHLMGGNPALIRISGDNGGWYTDPGGAHIMSLLAAKEGGLVYLYDTGGKNQKYEQKNAFGHPVNTFVPLTDVINHCGKGCWFQLIKE